MSLRFRESILEVVFPSQNKQTNFPFGMQVLGRRDFSSPCKSRTIKCPFELDVALRHKCAKENAWADEKHRRDGGRIRVWAYPRSLISWPSDQPSGLYCCFHLIQVFSPVRDCMCVCPSLLSGFTWGILPHLPVTGGLFYRKEQQLKFEGKGYSAFQKFFATNLD